MYGRKRFFQAAIVVFLLGSALSGASVNMIMLIICRAVQGLGAGGLMVGAQSIVGDVVPPRDRGRYQGLFGTVFGVASVAGPLLGGLFVQHLSWRWIFYVNLPVGAVALIVVAVFVPGHLSRMHHHIDYLGTLVLTLGVASLVLLTSLGGTTYAWASAPIYILGAAGVALLIVFVFIERRTREPVLPLHLFANRTFSAASLVSFIVGFAMFGAITFLPLFFQVVKGATPTGSGLRLLPLMAGLLLMSVTSGQVISRTGKYKAFPIAGTALVAVSLFLLSTMSPTTSLLVQSAYLLLLGIGIGSVIQVLVLVTQNSVAYSDLGVATSGASFFRSIGGSFGSAIFGAIFSNVLVGNLASQLHGVKLPAGFASTSVAPAMLDRLPAAIRHGFITAYSSSITTVFLIAVPIAALAFCVSWLIPQLELRRTTGAPPEVRDVETSGTVH